jgi:hypothetical protein
VPSPLLSFSYPTGEATKRRCGLEMTLEKSIAKFPQKIWVYSNLKGRKFTFGVQNLKHEKIVFRRGVASGRVDGEGTNGR